MEGLLFDVNLESLETRRLFDLVEELDIPPAALHILKTEKILTQFNHDQKKEP